jgi:Tol biopolymer transport system component
MLRRISIVSLIAVVGILCCLGAAIAQPPGTQLTDYGTRKYNADWSPDGAWIVYHIQYSGEIHLIPSTGLATGESSINLSASSGYYCTNPRFTPDSQRVMYTEQSSPWRVVSVDLDGNDKQVVLPEGFCGSWNDDETLLAYITPEKSKEIRKLMVYDVARNETRRLYEGYLKHARPPEFTKDGLNVLVTLPDSDGNHSIFRVPLDGSQQFEQLTSRHYESDSPHLSPDGQWILYYAKIVGHAMSTHDIWALNLVTGIDMPLYSCTQYDISTADWSPDGSEIAYVVLNPYDLEDKSNREIYIDTFNGHTTDPYVRILEPRDIRWSDETLEYFVTATFWAFNTGPLTLEFSSDGGETWAVVGDDIAPDATSYSFCAACVSSDMCQLRLFEKDNPSVIDTFVEGFYFTVDSVNTDPAELLGRLAELIGNSDTRINNALITKLSNAAELLEKGKTGAAINILSALRNQIEAQRDKKIDDYLADSYLDAISCAVSMIAGAAKPVVEPTAFSLSQNVPNPFNPVTTIEYQIPAGAADRVTLKVYDMRGAVVNTLIDRVESPGVHSVVWDATDATGNRVSSGVYIYRLRAGEFTQSNKMILMR